MFRRRFDWFQVIVAPNTATLANLDISLIQSQFGHTKYDLGHVSVTHVELLCVAGLAQLREALLGHANHSIAGHYASADVGHCSSRPTFCSIEAERRSCCAWVTVAGQAL